MLRLPVSTTHSIVGATLGFSLLLRGTEGIMWRKVAKIAASWVLSPLISGLVSASLYMVVDFAVLRRVSTIFFLRFRPGPAKNSWVWRRKRVNCLIKIIYFNFIIAIWINLFKKSGAFYLSKEIQKKTILKFIYRLFLMFYKILE